MTGEFQGGGEGRWRYIGRRRRKGGKEKDGAKKANKCGCCEIKIRENESRAKKVKIRFFPRSSAGMAKLIKIPFPPWKRRAKVEGRRRFPRYFSSS